MSVSIIVPVYKEKNLDSFLDNIFQNSTLENYEIIVVKAENDDTIVTTQTKNLHVIYAQKGRANQMNIGAKNANFPILLFLHADTVLQDFALSHIEEALADENISAGAFDLDFQTDKKSLKFIAKTASLRSRITRLPYGDQAIFIKKEIFKEINGFENIKIMEDINIMQKLKKAGKKIEILKQKVKTSPRKWEKDGLIYTTARNWSISTLYYMGINPDKLARYY